MATTGMFRSALSKVFTPFTQGPGLQQIRNTTDGWVNAWMRRDLKRRHVVRDNATMRVRLLAMKRNRVLPRELQELAEQGMQELPRTSAPGQLTWRCVITSRSRGNVHRWSLSRFVFRRLVDYNRLGGIQRAMW